MNKYLKVFLSASLCCGNLFAADLANYTSTFSLFNKIKLIILKNDISQVNNIDAIVNPANPQLLGGGGACGAIFNVAGWDTLQNACDAITQNYPNNRVPWGSAHVTSSCALQNQDIKYVIHAVGPDCSVITTTSEQDRLLEQTYINTLDQACQKQLHSIAFPFISAGIYGFPKERAAQIALKTVQTYCKNHKSISLKKIYFVLFSKEDVEIFITIAHTFKS